MKMNSLMKLLRKIHEDESGTVSLETILIIGAIALPILAFLLLVAWPQIKEWFMNALNSMENNANNAGQNQNQ